MKTHKRLGILLAASAVVLLCGCVPLSINPLYTDSDLVYEPGLEGVWGDPENPNGETWEFRKAGENTYRLIVRPEGEQKLLIDPSTDGLFEVHLLKLDGHLFMDIYPEEPEDINDFYVSHVIPAHSFAKVSLQGHVLLIASIDAEWLADQANQGLLDIRHERRGDAVMLTAATEELQKFVLAHIEDGFEDPPTEQKRLQ